MELTDNYQLLLLSSVFVILASALCSLCEVSIVAMTSFKIGLIKKENEKLASSLSNIQKEQPRYLGAIIMLNTIINVGGSAVIGALSALYHDPAGHTQYLAILTIIMLMYAEIKPKVSGAKNPEIIAKYVNIPIRIITFLLTPFVNAVNGFLGNKAIEESMGIAEMEHYISTASDLGIMRPGEAKIMSNVVDLRTKNASDVCNKGGVTKFCLLDEADSLFEFVLSAKHRRIILVNNED